MLNVEHQIDHAQADPAEALETLQTIAERLYDLSNTAIPKDQYIKLITTELSELLAFNIH